ncbi:MAG: hypothetical protein K940chlam1_01245 [Candidatus Anoxychlamydiales bacterium]|nr:hypothetical protein [Candidatus Anoxychlamydiales bacterium]NGX35411.1 hypothetical protein [Candidatus Anoxychlamydiales bacterium]
MSIISAYLGEVPAKCPVCYEDEDDKESLLQINCGRVRSVATVIIPHTFHKACIKVWAKRSLKKRSFSCPICKESIPLEELFSKKETKIQEIKSYAKDVINTITVSLCVGSMCNFLFAHLEIKYSDLPSVATATLLGLGTAFGATLGKTDDFYEGAKIISLGAVPSALIYYKIMLVISKLIPITFKTGMTMAAWSVLGLVVGSMYKDCLFLR